MIIQCTKKLADIMKIKLEEYIPEDIPLFFQWNANLFRYDRKNGMMLTNSESRYTIVLYSLKMEHFRRIDQIFLNAIEETFLAESIEKDLVNKYISKCKTFKFTKTHNRNILGQMANIAAFIPSFIHDYLPSNNLNLVGLSKILSNIPVNVTTNHIWPAEFLKKSIKSLK
ncbi:DUF6933 domain-containing protein [Fusobacterium sp. PH5-44]|uniref:DUF6933 domain-containing protein n=1 Tax=unclassified Fusobacterium TaxID=2648384 RepID=UPI003D1E4C19